MRKIYFAVFISLFIILPERNFAQEKDSSTALSIAEASLLPLGVAGAILVLNYEAFWKYADEVPFWVSPDLPYAMHIDKIAHGYFSAASSTAIKAGYMLAGVPEKTSAWLGAGITFG